MMAAQSPPCYPSLLPHPPHPKRYRPSTLEWLISGAVLALAAGAYLLDSHDELVPVVLGTALLNVIVLVYSLQQAFRSGVLGRLLFTGSMLAYFNIEAASLALDTPAFAVPLTRQLLSDVDFFMLGGATDTPVSNCFEKLFYLYPNAKFVLTTRPMQDWVRSMRAHYADPALARSRIGLPSGFQYGLLGEEVQVGLYVHHDQYEKAGIQHEQRVRHFFADKPADRLLIFNVFEGQCWPELCAFLGKPHPQKDFPWSNRRPR